MLFIYTIMRSLYSVDKALKPAIGYFYAVISCQKISTEEGVKKFKESKSPRCKAPKKNPKFLSFSTSLLRDLLADCVRQSSLRRAKAETEHKPADRTPLTARSRPRAVEPQTIAIAL